MAYTNLEATLTAADKQAVKDAFATVLSKLPFLVSLTPRERKQLFKTGPDSVGFVEDALNTVERDAEVLPSSFSSTSFRKDVELFRDLNELAILAASVAAQLDDTRMAAGSEAIQQATEVYTYIKAAAKKRPGLRPVAEQLGERFRKAKRKPPPDEP